MLTSPNTNRRNSIRVPSEINNSDTFLNTKRSKSLNTLRAIIIDDEPESLQAVTKQIELHCQQVEIVDTCDRGHKGIEAIALHQPDLIFLDIEMPGMTGLEMLERIPNINFGVIFITAYNKYALDAIKLSALDYLLKPLEIDELTAAVAKAEEKFNREKTLERFRVMIDLMEKQTKEQVNQSQRIALPNGNNIIYESVENILYVEASKQYCVFHFVDGKELTISHNIGYYEDTMEKFGFMRVHRSYIANLHKVKELVKQDGGIRVKLTSGKDLDVSRNKKDLVMEKLAEI